MHSQGLAPGLGNGRVPRDPRHKPIFTDSQEANNVFELKRVVEGILKQLPDEQRPSKDQLFICWMSVALRARLQAHRPPSTVGLAF
ncbi:Transcription elongation factor B polypeptide 2 [Fukomys damarensis]|uniref:Transcription elongation factor B polypeptide 2 n=1 Tax=Fukomys damarensis TaxID=885580 RepID=A0A091DN01_FUKDA|nr:Transcription elongation factor B polypeptide 2 [Fukomys damarensis]